MQHEIHLNKLPYEQMSCGNKTIEVRLNDEKRKQFKLGDKIKFISRENLTSFTGIIINKYFFKTFQDMAKNISLKEVGFDGGETPKEVVDCYRQYYTEQEELKYGVVGLKIEKID